VVPQKRVFPCQQDKVRAIDIENALYYGKNDDNIRRLTKNKIITDNYRHVKCIRQGSCVT